MITYTIGDAVKCSEWIHYIDRDTSNLVWQRDTDRQTFKGFIYRVCLFFNISSIRNW